MNRYSKMRRSNRKIKLFLLKNKFKNIHLFPHTKFIKDYSLDGVKFDGIATKNNKIVFFQNKTNIKPSKKILNNYKELEKKYNILCYCIVNIDRKGVKLFTAL